MTGYPALAMILIGAPVGVCIVHAIASRTIRYFGYGSVPPQSFALFTSILGNVPVLYLAWEAVPNGLLGNPLEIICGLAYVLVTYNTSCFLYFNLVNLTETSLHVNILMRLLVGGGTRPEELSRIYGVKDMISARIDRMIALGQLREKDERYFLCNSTLVIIGRAVNTWRKILGLPLSPG